MTSPRSLDPMAGRSAVADKRENLDPTAGTNAVAPGHENFDPTGGESARVAHDAPAAPRPVFDPTDPRCAGFSEREVGDFDRVETLDPDRSRAA
jgi:hypothetical protein